MEITPPTGSVSDYMQTDVSTVPLVNVFTKVPLVNVWTLKHLRNAFPPFVFSVSRFAQREFAKVEI
jgi:hypothetical protein